MFIRLEYARGLVVVVATTATIVLNEFGKFLFLESST